MIFKKGSIPFSLVLLVSLASLSAQTTTPAGEREFLSRVRRLIP